ncbi:hypothetical protein L7F22_057058 [Adiantum nelumboides]|nr:hypothetical protein [Adiantum nelumboides]
MSSRPKEQAETFCRLVGAEANNCMLYEPPPLDRFDTEQLFKKRARAHNKDFTETENNRTQDIWENVKRRIKTVKDSLSTGKEKIFTRLELSLDLQTRDVQQQFVDVNLFLKGKPWADAEVALTKENLTHLEDQSLVAEDELRKTMKVHDLMVSLAIKQDKLEKPSMYVVNDNVLPPSEGLEEVFYQKYVRNSRSPTDLAYPQSNGLVEKANGLIAGIIRKMVESKPKRWDNFLDGAIWAYRTTYRDATRFTPFHLVYGQEALQPIELNIPTIKLTGRQEQNNDEACIDRLLSLVELEWKREAGYHCYERKVLQLKDKLNEGLKDKEIKEERLVLRYNNALDNRFDVKFERRWEGPFIVKKDFTSGYYQLMDLNGKEHPRKVNGYRLKPYLSRILPTVFETKQVSKKTKKGFEGTQDLFLRSPGTLLICTKFKTLDCTPRRERERERERERNTVLGNMRSFVGNALGGLTGRSNLAVWIVAGSAAYFLWIKPERDAQKEREAQALLRAEADRYRYVERTKPIPDPQTIGLIKGVKKAAMENFEDINNHQEEEYEKEEEVRTEVSEDGIHDHAKIQIVMTLLEGLKMARRLCNAAIYESQQLEQRIMHILV